MYVKSFAGTARVYAVHTINIRHKLCATFALEFTAHDPHRHFNGVALVVAVARRECLQQDYCIKRTNIHMYLCTYAYTTLCWYGNFKMPTTTTAVAMCINSAYVRVCVSMWHIKTHK